MPHRHSGVLLAVLALGATLCAAPSSAQAAPVGAAPAAATTVLSALLYATRGSEGSQVRGYSGRISIMGTVCVPGLTRWREDSSQDKIQNCCVTLEKLLRGETWEERRCMESRLVGAVPGST